MMQIFLFFILFLFTAHPISAQQAQLSQRWVCLKVDWCLDQAAWAEPTPRAVPNPLCSAAGRNLAVSGHRVRLTAKPDAKPLPNADTYIVECLATSTGQVCTTGSTVNDMLIYGKDNTASLKTSDSYIFQGLFKSDGVTTAASPLKSKTAGDIDPVEWQSYSKGNARKFLALNFFDPNAGSNLMGAGAEQQGTFSFEVQSNTKDCVSISWDPYGRVFDSQSLEPIPHVSVTLLKKRSAGIFSPLLPTEILGGAINNPYTTDENGYFSFVVPDGTYTLSASNKNYIFPNNNTKLNSGYIKAYSDLYPNATGGEIAQVGTVLHRDIPLDSKTGIGISYPVKLVEYFYNLDKSSNTMIVEGLVSHPLTRIRFYSVKPKGETSQVLVRYKLLKTIQTDTYGRFKTEIDQAVFEPTEVFGDMELEKVNLVNSSTSKQLLFKTVEAVEPSISSVRLTPILNSLKGYAYDSQKNILSRANVGIYISYANKPYHQTKTDENGYYEVPSERLPDSAYTVKYSTIVGGAQTTSTSQFIAQNNVYLAKNNINLNSGRSAPKARLTQKPVSTQSGEKELLTKSEGTNFGREPSVSKPSITARSSQNNSVLLIAAVILLFLIAGSGVLLGLYLLRKNKIN